jgi:hypothetical protein
MIDCDAGETVSWIPTISEYSTSMIPHKMSQKKQTVPR